MSQIVVGVPSEVKNHEYRVGATPDTCQLMIQKGAKVRVQSGAGAAIGFEDKDYEKAGAQIVKSAKEAYEADLVIKVKEPQPQEFELMHEGQTLFTFLHLAPDPEQAKGLLEQKVLGIAYETVTDNEGRLPLLLPMSEVAGRISVHAGASHLHMASGGRGVLLGGVAGVLPAKVLVLGGGVAGTHALRMAMGLGADVTVMDVNLKRLAQLEERFGPTLKTRYNTPLALQEELVQADLVICAVLLPGKKAPRLITKAMLSSMKKGSVIVDISIDQGGVCETSRPTTHSDPTYVVDGVVHYCVSNMPGACARTATLALTTATLPYALSLCEKGVKGALLSDPHLLRGLNVAGGYVTHADVAADLKLDMHDPLVILESL